jgi:hypothetical protein
MSVERPDFIHTQRSQPEQTQPQQGRAKGKQSLQGPTTVDSFEQQKDHAVLIAVVAFGTSALLAGLIAYYGSRIEGKDKDAAFQKEKSKIELQNPPASSPPWPLPVMKP